MSKKKSFASLFLVTVFSLLFAFSAFAGSTGTGNSGGKQNSGNATFQHYISKAYWGYRFTWTTEESDLYTVNDDGASAHITANAQVLDKLSKASGELWIVPGFTGSFITYDYSNAPEVGGWSDPISPMDATFSGALDKLKNFSRTGKTVTWAPSGQSITEGTGAPPAYQSLAVYLLTPSPTTGTSVIAPPNPMISDAFNWIFRGGEASLWGGGTAPNTAPLGGFAPTDLIADPMDVANEIKDIFGGSECIIVVEPVSVVTYTDGSPAIGFTFQKFIYSTAQNGPDGAPMGNLFNAHHGGGKEPYSIVGYDDPVKGSFFGGNTEQRYNVDSYWGNPGTNRLGQGIYGIGRLYQNWVWLPDEDIIEGALSNGGSEITADGKPFEKTGGFGFYKLGMGGSSSQISAKKEQQGGDTSSFTTEDINVGTDDEVEYKITVTNDGENPINNVVITDKVPIPVDKFGVGELQYVSGSASDGGYLDGDMLTWKFTSIPAHTTKEVTFSVKVPSEITEECKWTNTATVEADEKISLQTEANGGGTPGGDPGDPGSPGGSPGGGPGGDPGDPGSPGGTPDTSTQRQKVTTPPVVAKYGDPEEPVEPEGVVDFVLEDYELNHVWDSLFKYMQGGSYGYLKTEMDAYSYLTVTGQCGPHDCPIGGPTVVDDKYDTPDYTVKYTESDVTSSSSTDGGGWLSADDNSNPVFLTTTWTDRPTSKGGYEVNTQGNQQIIDYAFNQMRWMYKGNANKDDVRVLSKFVEQPFEAKWGEDGIKFLREKLKMEEGHEVSSSADVDSHRDSNAWLKTITTDRIQWSAVWVPAGGGESTEFYEQVQKTHTYHSGCRMVSTGNGGSAPDHDSASDSYNGRELRGVLDELRGVLDAFDVGGGLHDEENSPSYTYKFTIFTGAKKYKTEPTGSDPEVGTPNQYIVDFTDSPGSNNAVHPTTMYRLGVSRKTGRQLHYFPEVKMQATFVRDRSDTSSGTDQVYTVGEEKRSTEAGAIMYMRLTDSGTPITGTIYSDTSVGGDTAQSARNNALTAGGDFTIKARMDGLDMNLYGYTMDIVDPDDNPTYATITNNYSEDIRGDWGNTTSVQEVEKEMQDWAAQFLDPRNYSADFNLYIHGNTYQNFSAVVGGFDRTADEFVETYDSGSAAYQVTVEAGHVTYSDELLDAIAADIDGTKDGVIAVLDDAGWTAAILNSIEHSKSTYNNSQAVAGLGDGTHWYDEVVRTIVVRRYKLEDIHATDIIAQDKLDITEVGTDWGSSADGSVSVSLWFGDKDAQVPIIGMEEMDSNVYKNGIEAERLNSHANANFIFDDVNVGGANFSVTYSTTNTRQ